MDLPVGWVTFFLAIATTALAAFAYSSSLDAKKLAQVANEELKALKEQNALFKDQFDASIKPAMLIFPAPKPVASPQFYIIVKNIGGGIAKEVRMEVKNDAGVSVGISSAPLLRPDDDLKVWSDYDPNTPHIWKVSVTGVKDILDRPLPDIVDAEVTFPPLAI